MRRVHINDVSNAVAMMFRRANFELAEDMRQALESGASAETTSLARNTILRILSNAEIAQREKIPMCQDTGLVVVFADIGRKAHIDGGSLVDAVNAGVRQGCKEGYLRASVTADPLCRANTGDNTPAVVHTELVEGDRLKLQLLAKGGGCENMSRFKMLTPAEGTDALIEFVVETAARAGPNACPPMLIGVGVGGSFEYSAVLSKKALLRRIGQASSLPHVATLEQSILNRVNASGIGPQGYGGMTTSLAVHLETAACHIASLPVSVNIECHAHRHQEVTL